MTVTAAPPRFAQLDYQGAKIQIRAETKWEQEFRVQSCRKEPWTAAWIEGIDPQTCVLWDVGANVGGYSLIASARGVTTLAFEPGYANYSALCDNVVANATLPGRILPLPIALSDETKLTPFFYSSLEAGAASHAFGKQETKSMARLDVLSMRADDFVYQFKMPVPTHVKLDVDGAEERVLKGMRSIFDAGMVQEIMIEMPNNATEGIAVNTALRAAGFREAERWSEREGLVIPGIHYELHRRV